ncbi:MAG: DUF1540 domain-containing protein [Peptococcaceae bacterium]|nr:DUF1540 domain-containing protein [Peptococcaceae bacterium]
MPDLKCTVDTCHYYGSGDHCTASGIEVNNQGAHANSSADTICETFKPKG